MQNVPSDIEDAFSRQRTDMVGRQLVERGIEDPRVLAAMSEVPRHLFVPAGERGAAYADTPLPIGQGQTISQPYIVAYMLQALKLTGEEKTLEVGTGSGYQSALLAKLTREVHSIERHPDLANKAVEILEQLSYGNVHVHIGDGSAGVIEHAPYDVIIVGAGAPIVPAQLQAQLKEGGRLLIPVGEIGHQILQLWTRTDDQFEREDLVPVAFVPLIGKYGWNN